MTEEEAKTKRCPAPIGTMHDERTQNHCIGSECMAWRWDMDWASSTEEGSGGDVVLRLKRLNGRPKQGFCGLAGKP